MPKSASVSMSTALNSLCFTSYSSHVTKQHINDSLRAADITANLSIHA